MIRGARFMIFWRMIIRRSEHSLAKQYLPDNRDPFAADQGSLECGRLHFAGIFQAHKRIYRLRNYQNLVRIWANE